MTAIKYKEGGTWKTLTMPSAVHIGASAPDEDIKQIWVDTDEGYAPSNYIAPLVSVLPTAPFDGQEVRYQNSAMATDGVVWTLRYRAASASIYKWEFVGGQPVGQVIVAGVNAHGTSGLWIGRDGPTVPTPLSGEYRMRFGCNVGAAPNIAFAWEYGVSVDNATPLPADRVGMSGPSAGGAGFSGTLAGVSAKTLTTAQTPTMWYFQVQFQPLFEKRYLFLEPLRVS